jgi:hypothetical protein
LALEKGQIVKLTAIALTHPLVRLEPLEPRHKDGLSAAAQTALGAIRIGVPF